MQPTAAIALQASLGKCARGGRPAPRAGPERARDPAGVIAASEALFQQKLTPTSEAASR